MVDYTSAIKRPFSDFKKLSIGALMYLIPLINIITGLFGSGYNLNCAKTAMRNENKLPEWKNFGSLFLKGLLVFVITLIYMIPLIAVSIFTLGSAILNAIAGDIQNLGTISGGLVIFFVIALLTFYILPMAILFFADKEKFSAAFRSGGILRKAFSGKYFVAWLLTALYFFLVSVVAALINTLTAVTIIIPFIVNAYVSIILGITGFTILGEVYSEIK
ncbi:MAG: DUF4013 domain-containing protein [Nanoarchaeota archaeon]